MAFVLRAKKGIICTVTPLKDRTYLRQNSEA